MVVMAKNGSWWWQVVVAMVAMNGWRWLGDEGSFLWWVCFCRWWFHRWTDMTGCRKYRSRTGCVGGC